MIEKYGESVGPLPRIITQRNKKTLKNKEKTLKIQITEYPFTHPTTLEEANKQAIWLKKMSKETQQCFNFIEALKKTRKVEKKLRKINKKITTDNSSPPKTKIHPKIIHIQETSHPTI